MDRTLAFAGDGAQLFRGAALEDLPELEAAVADLPQDRAGVRLHGEDSVTRLLGGGGAVGALAVELLGPTARPVRAILFNKSPGANWGLGWHQDRVIAVQERVETPGFGPWTVKSGMMHVAPSFDILAAMITVRVHIDDVPPTNAPLLIAPGSHRLGRIAEDRIQDVVQKCGVAMCSAEAGDVWTYSTPILHASQPASAPHRRRVLQVDFTASELPGRLRWLGI